jgi:TRAP-type C4-dicarboxylate transport system permease small subunit
MSIQPSALSRISSFLNRLEELLLGSLLISMVLLGSLQILFRNVLSISLFWIDPLLRHMVLWIALLGASVATRMDRHISIDLLSERLPPRIQVWVLTGVHLISAAVCFLLVLPAVHFVQEEYPMGKILALGIPIWTSEAIMPVMMIVLGLRFLGKARESFNKGGKFSSEYEIGGKETGK